MVVAGGWGGGQQEEVKDMGSYKSVGIKFQLIKMNKFWRSVAQSWVCS